MFLPLQYIMMIEQVEAQNNLANLSQRTNYITDWTDHKQRKYRQVERETIPQSNQQHTKPKVQQKRQKQFIKEVSQKYDLKKYQQKLQAINEVELPLSNRNLFKLEESYMLPRHLYLQVKEQAKSNLLRKKVNSIHSYRCIEGQFLKRKLQQFERKNIQSQKNIHSKQLQQKNPLLPRLLPEQRGQKLQFKKLRALVSEQEIQKIKRSITKQSNRYSVPLLINEFKGLPLIKGLLH